MALAGPAISLSDRRLGTIALMVATGMQAADAVLREQREVIALVQQRDLHLGVQLAQAA